MDRASKPKSRKISRSTADDIPVALREETQKQKSTSVSSWLVKGGLWGLGTIAFIGGIGIWLNNVSLSRQNLDPEGDNSASVIPQETNPVETPPPESTTNQVDEIPDNILGHLEYEVVPRVDLQALTPDGRILLRTPAAKKFRQMQASARKSGVYLQPLSGFRSLEEQQYLFFQVKEQRGQNTIKRATVSAPPGYSEHHTGYAIDIGDARVPATNLQTEFENTKAFRWLEQNAAHYSFELSFPHNNLQGIDYEPWHWRYVGDRHSLETFYKARKLHQSIR